jgi:hypothetical protein
MIVSTWVWAVMQISSATEQEIGSMAGDWKHGRRLEAWIAGIREVYA